MKKRSIFSAILSLSIFAAFAQIGDFGQFRKNMEEELDAKRAAYGAFSDSMKKDFDDFRKKANEDYARFMDREWESFKAFKAKPLPERPEPPVPFVKKDSTLPETRQLEAVEKEFQTKTEKPQAVNLVEFKIPIKSDAGRDTTELSYTFDFYNTPCRTRQVHDFSMIDASELEAQKAWLFMSNNGYTSLADDCMRLREELNLNDWGYIELIGVLTEKMFGQNSNEAVMAQMFLLVQSGYKVRIAKSQGKMVLMVPFKDKIYSYSYVPMQDGWYYILNNNLTTSSFSVFNLAYPKEQIASVQLCRQPRLKNSPDTRRILQSRDYPGMKIEVKPNLNLVDFYNHYPVTDSWQNYVQASLSEEVKNQIYPLFNEKIDGKSKKEAAEMLLNFVQTAFEYMTDQEQFGYERPLFADEMFYYPYADCEDRAILLSVLIRDLLDLDVILLNYPAHIATAVKFDAPVAGNYFTVDGDNYVVCDPTYIGASVGDCMPRYVGAKAEVIKID